MLLQLAAVQRLKRGWSRAERFCCRASRGLGLTLGPGIELPCFARPGAYTRPRQLVAVLRAAWGLHLAQAFDCCARPGAYALAQAALRALV